MGTWVVINAGWYKISLTDETDFLLKSGLHFVGELKQDAATPSSPESVKRDWQILASWLGHDTGPISSVQCDKIKSAWAAYLAIGLAPSFKLQSSFDNFSEQLKSSGVGKAPTEVMDVFDRLLATDEEIESKRLFDWASEKKRITPIFEGADRRGWWQRQKAPVRKWLFVSILWGCLTFLYAAVFDPFDVGGWSDLDEAQLLRVIVIAALPLLSGWIYKLYLRFTT